MSDLSYPINPSTLNYHNARHFIKSSKVRGCSDVEIQSALDALQYANEQAIELYPDGGAPVWSVEDLEGFLEDDN